MECHHADLFPQPDLRDSSSRRSPAYANSGKRDCVIGNGFLEVNLGFGAKNGVQAQLTNKLSGEAFELEFSPFRVWVDDLEISGADTELKRVEARGSSHVSSLTSFLTCDLFDVEMTYVVQNSDHFIQKRLVLRNLRKSLCLHRVSLFTHHLSPRYEAVLHDGGLYFPIVFYRSKKSGLFFCIDFPCYFATLDSKTLSFDYYPGRHLTPGRSFQTLTAHLGVYELTGRCRANPYHDTGAALDAGEKFWFRQYLQHGASSAQVPFVEMKAPETGTDGPSDLEMLEQCQWFGAQHVLLPRMLTSVDGYPELDAVKEQLARGRINTKFVWSRGDTENLRWLSLGPEEDAELPESYSYFTIGAFQEQLVEHYLAVMERHGFAEVEIMGMPIVPRCSPEQGRPGEVEVRGLLHQSFQGLVDVVATLKENFGHVSSAGSYSCYGVGLAHLFDSSSVLVDEHPLAIPDIHVCRLFADMGRFYFRRSHDFLLPKRMLTNSIGLAQAAQRDAPYPGADYYPWYLYHDSQGWRYALISAIATGLRHRFHPVPMDLSEADKAFARRWLKWEKQHLADLAEVEEILDEPGLGAVDGYSYTSSRGSLVFLFNDTYDPQEVRLRLHLDYDADYLVRELYPREMNYLGPKEGQFRKDSDVVVTLEPREARIIEAVRRSPAAAKRKRPEIFGAVGSESRNGVVLSGRPGERVTVGIRVNRRFSRRDVRFPGKPIQQHIHDWVYLARSFEDGRATLPQGAFPGKPLTPDLDDLRDVWLGARAHLPEAVGERLDRSPFRLTRPAWACPERLFFVVRFEPKPFFDPVRTASEVDGIPECHLTEQPIKSGIDLQPLNIGLKAWLNGKQCAVHPALASWKRFSPNPSPVVAYFFEAGSKLDFGCRNHVVLFVRHFQARAFRGVVIEHLPDLTVEKELTVS